MEPINTTLGHPAWKSTLIFNRTLNRAVLNPQWIRRRFASPDLLADGFLKVDDRAGIVHGRKLARRVPGGERLFACGHATSAFNLRQTSSTLARELKAEMRK